MKSLKFLRYFAIILFSYSFSFSLSAQESYIFDHHNIYNYISIYKSDVLYCLKDTFWDRAEDKLLARIDKSRFGVGYYGYKEIIAFQITADRTQIYFAEITGKLYRYTIADDKLDFVIDLLPDSLITTASWALFTLVWENDSTLYFGGRAFGRYNINTGELQNIAFFPKDKYVATKIVKHKNRYIAISHVKGTGPYRSLTELDLENPANSKMLIKNLHLGDATETLHQLISYQLDCDSVALYLENWEDYEHTGVMWHEIDMETYELKPTEYVGDIGEMFVNFHKDCGIIDLDMDNSTIGGNDFLIDELCNYTGIPISDTDVKVNNVWALDSITIKIKNASSKQYIGVPDGNYDIIRPNTANIALVNNGSTTNEELQKAIIDARYFNTGEKLNEIEVEFLAWYDGLSGDTARAYIKIKEQLPQAGEDIYKEYCKTDDVVDLYSLLDAEISTSGDFTDNDFNKIGSELDISEVGAFKGFYIVGVGECSDTALFEIIVNDIPYILPVKDTSMCYGSIYEVDLNYLNSDIEWSDGVKDKIRVIETSGDYIYKVTDERGCYASDTFWVFIGGQLTITPIDATICEGDTFPFLDKEYYEVGEYADTLKDINGCDSAYFDIKLAYFERSAIVLTGDLAFCSGESTTLKIQSEHRDLKLDGEDIPNTIEISSPGSYLLTGYDNNNCPSELRFEVSAYPNPQVFAEDIVDAEFSEPIKMPVDYSKGVVSYAWTPLSGLDCYDCPFPNITKPKDVIYTVEVTDENGCVSTQNISVSFKKIDYDIPNAIFNKPVHPDNGIFYVKSNISFSYDLEIYDRWGNMLYRAENIRTNDASAGWSPEGEVNSGVFVYKIEFDERGDKRVVAGDVTVL